MDRIESDKTVPPGDREADAPAVACREIGPIAFNSRLMHPLFTRLANLRQIVRRASVGDQDANKKAHSQKTVTKLLKDFLYFSGMVVRSIAALTGNVANKREDRIKC